MGFETNPPARPLTHQDIRVNLPRWGLKPNVWRYAYLKTTSVNLPRWGLKRGKSVPCFVYRAKCKFTPLGFETLMFPFPYKILSSVNLPRWGLKHIELESGLF